jgi:hypothetical protein
MFQRPALDGNGVILVCPPKTTKGQLIDIGSRDKQENLICTDLVGGYYPPSLLQPVKLAHLIRDSSQL